MPGAIVQSAVATLLGALLADTLGLELAGAASSSASRSAVASTVVVVRVLSDHNALHTPAGHIAVGWLVVEDIFTVLALVLLPALFGAERIGQPVWIAVGLTAAQGRRRWSPSPASSARGSFRACSIASPRRDRASCSR